jgi:hypothetical protein
MTSPTFGVRQAWGEAYRALCQQALQHLALSQRALPVGELTLDLVGAVIDPTEGTVRFPENPLPRINNLNFTIKDNNPGSEVARKQEALQLWEAGITQSDPLGFRIHALKEGLNFSMDLDEEKAAYETVVRNILFLYNDGRSPGEILLAPYMARPELQLRVLSSFMASPTMQVAEVPIINKFKQFRETLLMFLEAVLPESIPANPDEMAGSMPGPQGAMNGPPGGFPG